MTTSPDPIPTLPPTQGSEPTPSPSPDSSDPRPLWFDWTDRDQVVLLVLGLLVFTLIGANWVRWHWRGAPLVEIERLPENRYAFRIELNSATWVEWMQLEGIGEILARRIVEDREQHGPFKTIDELSRVPGVGTVTLDKIRPWIVCSGCKTVIID